MKRIMVVIGTRPEAIKLCPVILELKKRRTLSVLVASTAQHRELLKPALNAFGVVPDFSLRPSGDETLAQASARIMSGMETIFREQKPDLVLVQGDTVSAYASAMAAFYLHIPIGHVEAGLRTHRVDVPFPEELYRRSIALIAKCHFSPTPFAKRNLVQEGIAETQICMTGNTVIDALRMSLEGRLYAPHFSIPRGERILLFTAHRREHLDKDIVGMMRALVRIVKEFPDLRAICPRHPNPCLRALADEILGKEPRIDLIDPPDFVNFHRLLASSYLVMTDSGGIQEEATALGIPTVVMRYTSERTEGIRAGVLRLAGSGEDGIVELTRRLLLPGSEEYLGMRKPSRVFGDGRASVRIVDFLEKIS